MNGCVYRTTDGKCEFYSDHGKGIVSWCDFDDCEEKKPSNADRIRSMTDEELAELLTAIAKHSADKLCESLKTVDVDLSNCDFGILYKAHLSWLKQSVKEGKT